VLGLSIITNVHNPDDPVPATVEEIIEVAKGATPLLETIIKGITEKIYETEIR
jgi:purine-nucleoside phosphorylase